MKKSRALWITAAVAVILIVMGAVVIAKPSVSKTVPEGISFNGSSLAGLTPEEAKSKITEYMSYFNGRTIELTMGSAKEIITMDDIELTIEGGDTALTELEEAIPSGNVFQRYKKEKDLQKEPVDIKPVVSYNEEKLTQIITSYAEKYRVAVEEPTFQKTSSGFVTTHGATGIDFNVEQIVSDIKTHLQKDMPVSGGNGVIQYTAETVITEPSVSVGAYDNLNNNILGTFTTEFNGQDVDRTENLRLACAKLNGTVVLQGQEISLLSILGPFTYAEGYKDAGTIIAGENTKDIAGGICQVATTLYDAILFSEIEVTYRRNHSHISNYVEYSMDAMIHPSGNDFKFRNNLENPIYIEAGIRNTGKEGSTLTVTIYGTEYRPANRTVRYYHKTLKEEFPEPLYVVKRFTPSTVPESSANIPRLAVQTDVGVCPAVVAECWKQVLVDGVVVEDTRVNRSSYRGVQGVVTVGWDISVLYWIGTLSNGDHEAKIEVRDGRYWDPTTEDLTGITVIPWIGKNLNEDGTPKTNTSSPVTPTNPVEEPTTPAPTTPAPTEPAPTEPAPTEPAPTEPAPTNPPETTPEVPTELSSPEMDESSAAP